MLPKISWEARRGRSLPRTPYTISSFLQSGPLMARVLTLPRGPSHGSMISVLCWTRYDRRKTSSGCLRIRFRLAIGRGYGPFEGKIYRDFLL